MSTARGPEQNSEMIYWDRFKQSAVIVPVPVSTNRTVELSRMRKNCHVGKYILVLVLVLTRKGKICPTVCTRTIGMGTVRTVHPSAIDSVLSEHSLVFVHTNYGCALLLQALRDSSG